MTSLPCRDCGNSLLPGVQGGSFLRRYNTGSASPSVNTLPHFNTYTYTYRSGNSGGLEIGNLKGQTTLTQHTGKLENKTGIIGGRYALCGGAGLGWDGKDTRTARCNASFFFMASLTCLAYTPRSSMSMEDSFSREWSVSARARVRDPWEGGAVVGSSGAGGCPNPVCLQATRRAVAQRTCMQLESLVEKLLWAGIASSGWCGRPLFDIVEHVSYQGKMFTNIHLYTLRV